MAATLMYGWLAPLIWAALWLAPFRAETGGADIWIMAALAWLILRSPKWYAWLIFLLPWQIGGLVFLSYSHSLPTSNDLFLFFTHPGDIRESMGLILPDLQRALIHAMLLVLSAFWITRKFPPRYSSGLRLAVMGGVLVTAVWVTPPFASLKATVMLLTKPASASPEKALKRVAAPEGQGAGHLIVLVGESLRYDLRIAPDVKAIYSAGTNTDVVLPILLNGFTAPKNWKQGWGENLFSLAKAQGYQTAFISAQTEGNLRYIRPFLGEDALDLLVTTPREKLAPRYDRLLLDTLKAMYNPEQPQCIVLQMAGAHSPYRFYPESFRAHSAATDPMARVREDYDASLAFSALVLQEIRTFAREKNAVLLFTSDHGEMTEGPLGHNRFTPEVYRVPFVSQGLPDAVAMDINSHDDLYRLMVHLLGYPLPRVTPLKIHGSMQNGEDGFMTLDDSGALKHHWY